MLAVLGMSVLSTMHKWVYMPTAMTATYGLIFLHQLCCIGPIRLCYLVIHGGCMDFGLLWYSLKLPRVIYSTRLSPKNIYASTK